MWSGIMRSGLWMIILYTSQSSNNKSPPCYSKSRRCESWLIRSLSATRERARLCSSATMIDITVGTDLALHPVLLVLLALLALRLPCLLLLLELLVPAQER